MDNLSSHKTARAEAAIKACGARLVFLPPYSPDLNPIEMAFAKLKVHLPVSAISSSWPSDPRREERLNGRASAGSPYPLPAAEGRD